METPEMLAQVLGTGAGTDCQVDPNVDGPVIRVIFNAPYLGTDAGTGMFASTQPTAWARTADVASIVAEVTLVLIQGLQYVVERLEPLGGHGDQWRVLVLRRKAT